MGQPRVKGVNHEARICGSTDGPHVDALRNPLEESRCAAYEIVAAAQVSTALAPLRSPDPGLPTKILVRLRRSLNYAIVSSRGNYMARTWPSYDYDVRGHG